MRRPRHRPRPGHPGAALTPLRLQPLVRARVAALGEPGAAWRRGLPGLLRDLERQWDLTIGSPLPGGSASYVARAVGGDGAERVVKLLLPDPELADEARTLRAAEGRGYALLHAHDADRGALLLEALGPSLEHTPGPPEDTLDVLAATLERAWQVPVDSAPEVAPGQDRASVLHRLVRRLDDALGHPAAPAVRARAIEYAERRAAAFDPAACVVVHGDAHPANALAVRAPRPGAESGYVLVDPDGWRADPAYDLGVAVRDWTRRLEETERPRALLEGYCARLADRTGVDPERIWEWGFLERVSTGLYVLDFGAEAIGRRFLASAERLL